MESDTQKKSTGSLCRPLLVALSVMMLAACGTENSPAADNSNQTSTPSPAVGTRPQGLGSTNKVLILSGTVTGGASSAEAKAAKSLGYTVDVVNNTVWAAKTSADFAGYRAIILGDATCSSSKSLIAAAEANRTVWGPVVDGNVIVVGTDPVYHPEGPQLTLNSVQFASAQEGKTGMYVSLSCYYHDTAAGTPVPVLDQFGTFTVTGVGCYDDAHIVATNDALNGLTDTILSNWSCSVHEAFDAYPAANFTPLVIARDPAYGSRLPGSKDFADGSHGVPYIVVRGATPVRCGDGVVQYPEECDTGSQNGVAGTACSSVCRLHWCGDGKLDSGEDCDNGAANGTGSCTASCKTVAVANHPPVAKCQDLNLPANYTCGATGSVDNGSYDPDNNLVSCVQSPSGTFPVGTTTVTLTCTDTAGLSSTCTANVTVTDVVAPTITCPPSKTAECVSGGANVTLGNATATDQCSASVSSDHSGSSFPVGTTTVTYTATDGYNSSTCTAQVAVADHLAPMLNLLGAPSYLLECPTSFVEPGAQALDTCDGDLTAAITRTGSVDTKTPGTYTLTYSVKDAAGHVTTATRSVTVVPNASGTCEDHHGGWILTGSMALPRLQHTATLLDDGRVLVAGGYNVTSELYDSTAKTWSATGNNLGTHRGHTATKLQNGNVLIAGGGVCPLTSTTAELYIPSVGKWKAANPLNEQRYYHAAVLLPNGKVLVAGGFTSEFDGTVLASSELYDPATGAWTYTGSLNQARGNHTMTLLPNGQVLVAGGSTDGDAHNPLSSAELYDPATGKWTLVGSLGTARALHTATLLPNGQVLAVGGGGLDVAKSASAELYDPATGAWTATGSMTSPREWHTAVVLPNGEVLVAGGYHPLTGIMTSSERYNPATGKWSVTAAMNVDRYRHTLTLLNNGTALAVGGASNHNQASAEYYDLSQL